MSVPLLKLQHKLGISQQGTRLLSASVKLVTGLVLQEEQRGWSQHFHPRYVLLPGTHG